ncbi:sensor histidine kinase [Halomonas sp.]|uniref:sensor histidine kinase n=1 Tax=Halomonas sp. TaxID=1486246 RepID=UPI00384B63C8
MMQPRRPAFVLPGLAILAFATFLGFALVRLAQVEQDMRLNVDENMLWVVTQAQVASHRLDGDVHRLRQGNSEADPQLRFDILTSRLVLLDEGPQRRYLERLGFADSLDDLFIRLHAIEASMETLTPQNPTVSEAIQAELAPMARQLNRIANAVMVEEWEAVGARLDAHRDSMVQAIASVLGILVSGLLLVALLIINLRQRRAAQHELASHRDQLEEEIARHISRYKETADALARALSRERGVSEFYRSFAAMVSHQFRTPLAVIDSGLQRLLRRGDRMTLEDRQQRYTRLRNAVAHMTRLVESALTAARLDVGQLEATTAHCDLASIAQQVCQFQEEDAGTQRITFEPEGSPPLNVVCDRALLEQILANLVSNALKYSPPDTPITVRLDHDDENASCHVQDRGIGIPEEDLPRLFERFFRSRNVELTPGIGLGLNIARHLARLQRGDIKVVSREGEGTIFTLTLPLASELPLVTGGAKP